jgi:hypothetical protein
MIKYIIKQLCFCLMCLLLNLNTSLYALEQNSEETQERLLVNESGQPPKEPPMKSPKQPAGMIITENRTDSTGVDLSFPLPVKEDFQDPNLARSVLQVSTLFGLGLAWFYYEKDNQEDQLYNTRSALIERFTSLDAWKFDTNVYETNAVAHPLAGAGYYLIARTNGYSNLESLAFSYAGSAVWEYLIEYMEVVSINDMVFTPIGGMIIGENAYQLASFYAANYSNFFPDWMVSDRSRYAGGLGRNGMASTIWHDLNYQAGVSYFDSGSTCLNLGVDLELYGLRNLKRLGTTRGFTDNAPYSHTVITADVSATEMKRFDMYVETSIFSYINQRIRDTESGAKGYSLILSMNTAWEYDRRIFSGFNDKVGIIHVLGPAVDFSLMKDSFLLRLKSSVFGDFSMIKSLGLMGYLDDGHTNDDVEAKGPMSPPITDTITPME